MTDSDTYEHRHEHGVTHFHDVVFMNNKPIMITLTEPIKNEPIPNNCTLIFRYICERRANRQKITIVNNLDYPFL